MQVPSLLLLYFPSGWDTYHSLGPRLQGARLGCHMPGGSFLIFPGPERLANSRAQLGLWPTPNGGFSIADARAIKVGGHRGLL